MTCTLAFTWVVLGYTVEDIGPLPGDPECRGLDLNEIPQRDQVVGYSDNAHAFLWEKQENQPAILLDLESLFPPGAPESVALGVNNQFPSAVVGYHSFIGPGQPSPVLWEKLGRTVLPRLGGGTGEARSVNDAKVIAGWSTDAKGTKLACRWAHGMSWSVESLGTLGGPTSQANRISQTGTVVGQADVPAGIEHAFRWVPGGVLQDIHVGPGSSAAMGVNVHDEVVGEADPGTTLPSQAFRWSPSAGWQILPGLSAASSSFATNINDRGVTVGRSDLNGPQAVIWYGTQIARLTDQILMNPGWQLVRAESINNRGQIVGYGKNPAGNWHTWLLEPVKYLVPRLFCYRDFKVEPPIPSRAIGQIAIDGGGIIITPGGGTIHVRPPRPDPEPMSKNVIAGQKMLEMVLAGRSELGKSTGREILEMIAEIGDSEPRRVFEELGRNSTRS